MATTSSVAASSSAGTLDVPSLVSQLMTVERRPIDKLNTQITSFQTKISSFGTIKGLVSSFDTALTGLTTNLGALSATSSDTSVLSASASSSASIGTYSLSISKLAQSQGLVAAGRTSASTAISDGVATTVTFNFGSITGGTLAGGVYSGASFVPNGSATHSITIDASNNTLQGISDAINAAQMGVTATVVNDGSGTPYRLSLTSSSTGVTNSLKITTSGGDGTINSLLGYDPAGTQNLSQTIAAQNSAFTVNGIAISKASNTVTDAIQGVTLNLNNLTTTPASLTVAHNTQAVSTAVSTFVDAYNAMVAQLKSRSAYGNATTAPGVLSGDATVRIMQNQLREVMMTATTGGTLTSLSQIGISTQADGSLKLDSTKLNNAIASNFSDVTNLISGATGFATRLSTWSHSVLTAGGLIDNRLSILNTNITSYNDQINHLEVRMGTLQKLYTTQYSNLNMLLTSMNSTSAYLTQQLTK